MKKVLNLKGLRCPEPMMKIRQLLRTSEPDELIQVISDDPSTRRDLQIYCSYMKHKLLSVDKQGNVFSYTIQSKAKK